MMFQEEVERRARKAADIDTLRVVPLFSQIRADNPFVAGFRAESGLSQTGIDTDAQVRARDKVL